VRGPVVGSTLAVPWHGDQVRALATVQVSNQGEGSVASSSLFSSFSYLLDGRGEADPYFGASVGGMQPPPPPPVTAAATVGPALHGIDDPVSAAVASAMSLPILSPSGATVGEADTSLWAVYAPVPGAPTPAFRHVDGEGAVSRIEREVAAALAAMEEDRRILNETETGVKDALRQVAALRVDVASIHRAVEKHPGGEDNVQATVAAVAKSCRLLEARLDEIGTSTATTASALQRQRENALVRPCFTALHTTSACAPCPGVTSL
jgi:hypothetical protein